VGRYTLLLLLLRDINSTYSLTYRPLFLGGVAVTVFFSNRTRILSVIIKQIFTEPETEVK